MGLHFVMLNAVFAERERALLASPLLSSHPGLKVWVLALTALSFD